MYIRLFLACEITVIFECFINKLLNLNLNLNFSKMEALQNVFFFCYAFIKNFDFGVIGVY